MRTPDDVIELAGGFADSVILAYAVKTGLFEFSQTYQATASLAASIQAHPAKLGPILTALSGLQLLRAGYGGTWINSPIAQAHLVEGCADDLRPFICHMVQQWRRWIDLDGLLAGGLRDDHQDRSVFVDRDAQTLLLASTGAESGGLPSEVASYLPSGISGVFVDVGGGHGRYASEIVARHPGLKGEVWDTPLTAEIAEGHDGIAYFGCDLLDSSTWPARKAEVVLLANLVANLPFEQSRALVRRLVSELEPSIFVLVSPWLDEARRSPLSSCLFGVVIATACDAGWLPSVTECRSWLLEEFSSVSVHRVADDGVIIGWRS